MLILSRYENEAICIGDDIRITVARIAAPHDVIRKPSVRLGIEAPRELSILREEILSRRSSDGTRRSSEFRPRPQPKGKRRLIPGAVVRLRIQAPPETSVRCSRASRNSEGGQQIDSNAVSPSPEAAHTDGDGSTVDVNVVCSRNDHILIDNQLLLLVVDVGQFLFEQPVARA